MLDDAILAGGIHALEHDQHRPSAMGVQALLHVLEPRDAVGKDRADFFDVGRETETFRRIEERADRITEEIRMTRGVMDDARFQALLHDDDDA